MQIYINKDGQQHGPYTVEQLQEYLQQGHFTPQDHACYDGQNWVTVGQVPGLAAGGQAAAAQPQAAAQQAAQQPAQAQAAAQQFPKETKIRIQWKPKMKEYKAIIYQEGMLGSLLLGQSKVDPIKLTNFLNANATEGWRVVTMDKDQRRMLLFFKREALVIIMERDKQ